LVSEGIGHANDRKKDLPSEVEFELLAHILMFEDEVFRYSEVYIRNVRSQCIFTH
jgi:hypothetical protein